MANKEATVFVIDVGPSMALTKQPDSKATRLDIAQAAFQKLLQKKLVTGRKLDQVGLIFFGTDETRNELAQAGRYENIVTARPIAMADLPMLKMPFLKGSENGDVLDALIVATDLIAKHCRHLKYEKKIILITDAEGSINQADLEKFGDIMVENNCQLTVMGLDFDDPEYGVTQARKPATKRESEGFLRKLVDMVGGSILPMEEAIRLLDIPRPKIVRPVPTFRGALTIGDPEKYPDTSIIIPILMYSKTMELKAPSSSKYSALNPLATTNGESSGSRTKATHAVSRVAAYKKKPTAGDATNDALEVNGNTNDNDGNDEVPKDSLDKAYMYGKTIVPIRRFDEDLLVLHTIEGLSIIGFFREVEFQRDLLLANVLAVLAPKGEVHATRALTALARALFEKECFALARFVRRDGANPKLGIVFPRIKHLKEGLFFAQVPYAEDVRHYIFASLDEVEGKNGKVPHPLAPTDHQVGAMRDFVNKMDMMNAATDEDGDKTEYLKPRNTYNPAWHRLWSSIQHRAIHPEEGLPPIEPFFQKMLEPLPSLFESAKREIDELRTAIPTKKVEGTKQSRRGKGGWRTDEDGAHPTEAGEDGTEDESRKRIKSEPAFDETTDLGKLTDQAIRVVSTSDAIKDFEAMMRNRVVDLVETAITQMSAVISQFVFEGFADQFFDKAIDCIQSLRQGCLKNDESESFNAFIRKFRDQCVLESAAPAGRPKPEFWNRIKDAGITLISNEEAKDSKTTVDEAQKFLAEDTTARDLDVSKPSENEEDLEEEDLMAMLE